MGTNYYAHDKAPCETCHREWPSLHIGKSSAGWKFLFASYDEPKLQSAKDWWEYLGRTGARIIDEYGRPKTLYELKKWVDEKQDGMWQGTAPKEIWGPFSSKEYEYLDDDGYRISKSHDFS